MNSELELVYDNKTFFFDLLCNILDASRSFWTEQIVIRPSNASQREKDDDDTDERDEDYAVPASADTPAGA